MAIRDDEPCYNLACKLGDVEHTIATQFSLCNGTIGKDMVDSLVEAKAILQDINDQLKDALPHLSNILQTYHADEQRDYEEETETKGEKPTNHIYLSIDKMADFLHWAEDLSDV